MSIEVTLIQRADSKCELCGSPEHLAAYAVSPDADESADTSILVCETCRGQITGDTLDANHWRCLNDSMWSQVPAVQVMAYRTLHRLSESWAQDLLDMLYLDDTTKAWADEGLEAEPETSEHKDCNGVMLFAGDTVTLIKDLPVKGSSLVAKRGTAVRGISLVASNPEHIEGRVDGQRIVILTQYVKKQ